MNKCAGVLALTVLAGLLPAAARADVDVLDKELNAVIGGSVEKKVPSLYDTLKEKGYNNVGVLRFRVQRGSAKASFKAPLCGSLATRVENLLVMHNAEDPKDVLGVIHDAGAVAGKKKIASWYSKPDARKKLFELEYPLAWGQGGGKPPAQVKADVFITGLLKTSPDMRKTTVTLQYFDPKTTDLVTWKTFSFKSDRNIPRGFGYSFAIPSKARARLVASRSAKGADVDDLAFEDLPKQDQQDKKDDKKQDEPEKKEEKKQEKKDDKKQDEPEKKEEKKAPPRAKQDTSAKPDNVGGVQLQMLVDGKPADFRPATASEGDPIAWQVTSPLPGQKVSFRLRNTTSDQQLGVVLRLNGASTFQQQTVTPEKCQKWVINAGKRNTLEGYYMLVGKKMQIFPIKVAVGEEAKSRREAFGDKAGLIEVDVYQKGSEESTEDERPMVSAKGLPPSKERKMRESYVSLRDAMIKSAGLKRTMVEKREILVPDETPLRSTEVEEVPFKNPLLVAHITIKIVPAGGDAGGTSDDPPVED